MMRPAAAALLPVAAVLLLAVTVVGTLSPDDRAIRAGHADAGYLNSTRCADCHPDHVASWRRTFHRTMTQEASLAAIQGDFTRNNSLDYQGARAEMTTVAGRYFMAFTRPNEAPDRVEIFRTVGSRRIQQYLAKNESGYYRLPVAWDIARGRWMHLGGSFFHRDNSPYDQTRAPWDPNCVFCHNVKAQPHYQSGGGVQSGFRSEVAELGIACGSCHGPAAAHADQAASPWRRDWWRLSRTAPRGIVNPARLEALRSVMVCGHCHGQRLPEPRNRLKEFMTDGDPYNAGDDLGAVTRPVDQNTTIGSLSFASRFWDDGSPRLTAYEYQGILGSRCFRDGHEAGEAGEAREGQEGSAPARMTCLSCHAMHGGEPRGMQTAQQTGEKPCLTCHVKYSAPADRSRHSGHAGGAGSPDCLSCHMPPVVYGVMTIHPSHLISVPDPAITTTRGVPNACNLCHLDHSAQWARQAAGRLWPARFQGDVETKPGDPTFSEPEGPRMLHAGDAVTRAVAAFAFARRGAPVAGLPGRDWARARLLLAAEDDYPVVRLFAADGLKQLTPMQSGSPTAPDYLAAAAVRKQQLAGWRDWLLAQGAADELAQAEAEAKRLRPLRQNRDVEVGE